MRLASYCLAAAIALLVLAVVDGSPAEPEISVSNTARLVGNGRYDWTVFLVANRPVLESIDYVEYTLHPTFPNPVRRVTTLAGGFALTANGWGEFNIQIKIIFKNQRVRYLTHWLSLRTTPKSAAIATKPPHTDQHGVVRTRNTSRPTGTGQWSWEIFVEADDRTLGEIECVTYTLHPTFPQPVQRVCTRGRERGRGFKLQRSGWGTFTVGVEIQFKDGDVRRLTHALSFETARSE